MASCEKTASKANILGAATPVNLPAAGEDVEDGEPGVVGVGDVAESLPLAPETA